MSDTFEDTFLFDAPLFDAPDPAPDRTPIIYLPGVERGQREECVTALNAPNSSGRR